MSDAPALHASERRIVLLLGAVHFVNILDFMMVMPLGPDFARELGIAESALGVVGGAYTAAAAVAGLAGATVLDRFDRRAALALTLTGLFVGTLGGAFATGMGTLVAARVVAGAFGGPATAVAHAILADTIPVERRGRALGAVMGAFSVSSVFGVPFGLEVAHRWGWRAPFLVVAGMGVVVAAAAIALLPSLTAHRTRREDAPSFTALLAIPGGVAAGLGATLLYASGFLIIPNISSWFQGNLGVPREDLGWLYLAGGSASFVVLRVLGRAVDRFGSARVLAASSVVVVGVMIACFGYALALPPFLWFVFFMSGTAGRNVAWQTLTSKVPTPATRARFMSLQSALQHGASAAAALVSAALLSPRPGGGLLGMERVVVLAVGLSVGLVGVVWGMERGMRARGSVAPPVGIDG